ncbi:MAG: hypothetical protein JW808_08355 [Victivallales bacterium]|nr:hypothetical protein [Victivallales bacterium]
MNKKPGCDVVFYEAFEEEELSLRKLLDTSVKCHYTWKTIQESGHVEPPADIVSIRTQSRIPSSWGSSLRAVITRSTGYDHILPFIESSPAQLLAAYLPEYAARAVAEQAMLLWTALLRKMPLQQSAMKTFSRDGLTGRELLGKTVCVVGVGRIGSQIAGIAKALDMQVIGVDIRSDKFPDITYCSIHDAVSQADIIVCAASLTESSKALLSYSTLKKVRPGTLLVNIARGEISPSEDLLKLIREGTLGGIGLDVYEFEDDLASVLRGGRELSSIEDIEQMNSVAATLELLQCPMVISLPHNAFNTAESLERKCLNTARNVLGFIKSGSFISPIPGRRCPRV